MSILILFALQIMHVHSFGAGSISRKKKTVRTSKSNTKKTSKRISQKTHRQQSSSTNALQAIKQDIEKAKRKVGELELQEKTALKGLARAKKQQLMVKEHVGKLMGEVRELQDTLETIRRNEASIQQKLNMSRIAYSRIAKKYQSLMQKHAPDIAVSPDLLSGIAQLPDQSSINRLPSYMKQMHVKLSIQLREMQSLQGALTMQQEQLSIHTSRQERLLRESEYEQHNIRNILADQKKKLETVRAGKEEMLKLIAKKEQSERQLAGMISSMVKNDIAPREAKSKSVKSEKVIEQKVKNRNPKVENKVLTSRTETISQKEKVMSVQERVPEIHQSNDNTRVESIAGSFSGGFRWPSSAKRILRGFGQYRNSVTNTVMDNPGLDIACQSGSSAMCAAPGTVSLVHWLPGYNSMVIVDHGNSYRTVYANLASISVKKGQKIDAGGLIGRTTQSVDGEFLHFEIWKGKQRMNPMAYLR